MRELDCLKALLSVVVSVYSSAEYGLVGPYFNSYGISGPMYYSLGGEEKSIG